MGEVSGEVGGVSKKPEPRFGKNEITLFRFMLFKWDFLTTKRTVISSSFKTHVHRNNRTDTPEEGDSSIPPDSFNEFSPMNKI